MFESIRPEIQCLEGQGQNSSVWKGKIRIPIIWKDKVESPMLKKIGTKIAMIGRIGGNSNLWKKLEIRTL